MIYFVQGSREPFYLGMSNSLGGPLPPFLYPPFRSPPILSASPLLLLSSRPLHSLTFPSHTLPVSLTLTSSLSLRSRLLKSSQGVWRAQYKLS